MSVIWSPNYFHLFETGYGLKPILAAHCRRFIYLFKPIDLPLVPVGYDEAIGFATSQQADRALKIWAIACILAANG